MLRGVLNMSARRAHGPAGLTRSLLSNIALYTVRRSRVMALLTATLALPNVSEQPFLVARLYRLTRSCVLDRRELGNKNTMLRCPPLQLPSQAAP